MTSTLDPRRKRSTIVRPGDRIFSGLSTSAGILILIVLAGVAAFLTIEGIPGITASPDEVKSGQSFLPYVWPLVYGTLLAATIALLISIPVAIGVAILSTALPYTLEMVALTRIPARTFGTLMSIEPAFGALSGLLFLQEYLTLSQWMAILCIILASVGATMTMGSAAKPAIAAD